MFLKNRNISSKIKISKVTDYAALKEQCLIFIQSSVYRVDWINIKHCSYMDIVLVVFKLVY